MPLFPTLPWLRSAPATTIRMRDPLAASLGLAQPDQTVTISIAEVARAVGRLDPLVTRTFTDLSEALGALYRDGVPVRGEIHADIGAADTDPVALVVGRVLTAVLAATPEEAPGRAGRLRFQGDQGGGKVRLVRTDRKDTASFVIPRSATSGPDVSQLLDRASRGRSTPAETEALQRAIGHGHGTVGPPVISILGVTEPGQQHLIEALLDNLTRLGLKVGVIRRSTMVGSLDHDGSVTNDYSQHGAYSVVAVGTTCVSLIRSEADELPLAAALSLLSPDVQIVLCDGYREAGRPSIVLCGAGESNPAQRLAEARLLTQVASRLLATVGASSCDDVAPDFAADDVDSLARHVASRLELGTR